MTGNPTILDQIFGPGPNFWDQDSEIATKPDTILGGTGNDTVLSSTLGGSQLEGNQDNDSLTSRGPDDTLFGGQGNDELIVNSVSRAIGDDGRDTLTASATATLYGGADRDFLLALSVNNLEFGNQGNDTILGGAQGGDSIYGGQDNDLIGFTTAGGTSGTNIGITIGSQVGGVNQGSNFIAGNLGNDTIVGTGSSESLYGGQDDDSVVGVGDNTFVAGDLGDDIVEIRNRTDNIIPIGGQTPLEVTVGISNTTLQGGDGNDFLLGGIGKFSEGSNVFDGGAGNDTIQSFAVQDSISGGDGDDILMTMTSDVLTAEGVNSGLPGFAGESTLDGGEGDDTITASFESDIMFGGGGDDLMSGLFTLMDGGDGNDTLDGSGFVRTATTSLEVNLSGGAGNDLLIGASQAETATGLINIFAGGSGDDTITLNSTSDVLLTDSANLEGNDSITANYEFENDIAPEDEVFTFFDTLGDNIINGSLGDDSIVGGDGDDILRGGTQVDITDENRAELPFIGAGNDTIAAGGGDDFLFGGQGDDSLIGQDGNDTLQGSFNSDPVADGPSFGDTLVGGEGNDSFFYQFQDEVFQSNGAVSTLADLIGDFETLSDRLVFTRASGTNGGFNFASTGRPNDSELIELGANQTYIASPGTNISTPNTVVADIGTGVLVYQRQGGTMLYDPDGNGPLAATTLARFSLDNDGRGPDISRTDVTFI